MTDSRPHPHPMVASYFRELEVLLGGLAPAERADVVAGVREHLHGSLGTAPSEAGVRSALARLGPPEAIADEAYAAVPGSTPTLDGRAGGQASGRRWSSRPFVPVVVGLIVFALLGIAGLLASFNGHPVEFLLLPVWFSGPLLVMVVLVTTTELWQGSEKRRLLLTVGVGYLLCAAVSATPPLLARSAAVLVVGLAAVLVGRLVVMAYRRATAQGAVSTR